MPCRPENDGPGHRTAAIPSIAVVRGFRAWIFLTILSGAETGPFGNLAAVSALKRSSCMQEPDLSLILWPLAAEEFAAFFRHRLPAIMTAQVRSQSAQIKTLLLLASICDGLAARASFLPAPDRTQITGYCEKLSAHMVPVLANLPRDCQLEYRRILRLCELAWQVPATPPRGVPKQNTLR